MIDKLKALEEFIDQNNYTKSSIYMIGNASLFLQGYVEKDIRDIDIIIYAGDQYDIEMPSGRVDCVLDYLALLANGWEERSIYYDSYKNVNVYLVSLEDIIINKISGYHIDKHKESIAEDIKIADMSIIKNYIDDIKQQEFILIRDELFRKNIYEFEKDYLGVE